MLLWSLGAYFKWHLFRAPLGILKGWGNALWFVFFYFSTLTLLKSLAAPWHRYQWFYPKRFEVSVYAEVFLSNLISRTLGGAVRLLIIFLSLLAGGAVAAGVILALVLWLALPALMLLSFLYGFQALL